MPEIPLCSVVMAVYNGAESVSASINSVLNQTWNDFEFIIINDASTDNTAEILCSFKDERIKIVTNNVNSGLSASLNKGIKNAKGKYIIRMDADDICLPDRFKEQVIFMEANPDVGICGTWFECVGFINGITKYETSDIQIKLKMLHECHILHPSIMIRKETILMNNLYYNDNFRKNEDYELFVRAIEKVKFANIPKALIKYTVTEENYTRTILDQKNIVRQIKKGLFVKLGLDIDENDLNLYEQIAYYFYVPSKEYILSARLLLEKMIAANNKTGFYPKEELKLYLGNFWRNICLNTTQMGIYPAIVYFRAKAFPKDNLFLFTLVKIFIKGILKV